MGLGIAGGVPLPTNIIIRRVITAITVWVWDTSFACTTIIIWTRLRKIRGPSVLSAPNESPCIRVNPMRNYRRPSDTFYRGCLAWERPLIVFWNEMQLILSPLHTRHVFHMFVDNTRLHARNFFFGINWQEFGKGSFKFELKTLKLYYLKF